MSRSKAEEGISSCHGFALAPRPLTTMSPFACESSVDTNKTACKTRGGVGSRQDYSPQERREDPAFISVRLRLRLRLRLRAPLVRHALALPPPAAALLSGHATWALPGDEIASESMGGVCVWGYPSRSFAVHVQKSSGSDRVRERTLGACAYFTVPLVSGVKSGRGAHDFTAAAIFEEQWQVFYLFHCRG
jgi:hypothetical protein